MTALSTTWRRLWSAFVDHKLLSEPTGSLYAVKGMTHIEMRRLQKLGELVSPESFDHPHDR